MSGWGGKVQAMWSFAGENRGPEEDRPEGAETIPLLCVAQSLCIRISIFQVIVISCR